MRRLAGGLWSAFWLAVLLVGLPAVLVRYVGWPLPDHWPAESDWQRWAAQPLTRSTLVGAAAVVGWLLWALLAYAMAVEVLTRVRRAVGWLGRLRLPALPTPMQATASGMLGAAVFGLPAGAGQLPAGPVATQPAAPAQAAADGVSVGVPAQAPAGSSPDGRPTAPRPAYNDPGQRGGVELPDGGWVTDQTATATVAAAALVWLRRRRRYRPRPPAGAARDDPDLAPLPATVAAIEGGLYRRQAGDDADDERDQPDAAVAEADHGTDTGTAIGQPAGEPLHPHHLPAGGLGLTGAGAAAAARGLLTAILLAGAGSRPGTGPQVVSTKADLDSLVGPAVGDIPGLTVAGTLDEALGFLELAVLARGQAAAHHSDRDPADVAGGSMPPDGLAPLVLLAGCPTDPATARRLAVILTLAAPLRITGVLLGAWPHGTTWLVDSDGSTHPADAPTGIGPRLSVLTATATADLLTLLREAHPCPAGDPFSQPPPGDNPRPAPVVPSRRGQHRSLSPDTAGSGGGPPDRRPLSLRVLGAPAIHHTADAAAPLPVRRSAAIQGLAFLAVHRDGATSTELAAALWPGLRPHAAAGRLYTPISTLRTTLHEAAGADVVVRDDGRYRLDDRHLDVDLWRLQSAVEDAAAALDPAARQRALRAVVDAYTGELAAGWHWPWLPPHREAARRHVIDAYVALATAEPDPAAALAFLQGALRTDPFNEDLQRRVRGHAATR